MEVVININREEYTKPFRIFWCKDCGTVYDEEQDEWLIPNSVHKTKDLVAALIKANDRASDRLSKLNRMADDWGNDIGWADRDR